MMIYLFLQANDIQGAQRRMVLEVKFFEFLKLNFWFVVAIFDLVNDVKSVCGLC